MDMTDQFQRVSWAFLQAQKEEDSAFARKRRVGALDGGKTRSVNLLPEIDGMESENDASEKDCFLFEYFFGISKSVYGQNFRAEDYSSVVYGYSRYQ